jgi:hypothetical protein
MNDTISAWVGIAGLTITLLGTIVAFAFWAGKLSERVDQLKEDGVGTEGMKLAFARFEARMEEQMKAQAEKLSGLFKDLVWLRQAALPEKDQRPNPPRGPRR